MQILNLLRFLFQRLNKSLIAACIASNIWAVPDANLTALKDEPFGALHIEYSTLKKTTIGDILNKPLPIGETSYILKNRSGTYNSVKEKLNSAGVPQELIFVAMTESKLSPIKTGKYVGIWQLSPTEAKKAGLAIGKKTQDERYNSELATDAAIKEFKRLYSIFGRWDLAILAYNCGEGSLRNAINKAGGDSLDKLFDPKKRVLPHTSRITLQRVLAIYAATHKIELQNGIILSDDQLTKISLNEQGKDENSTD